MNDPDAAARDRVGDLLERLTRVNLGIVVVAPPDATRNAAQARARAAAVAAGRGDLLDEAVAAAREATIRGFSRAGFSGTWAATDWSISVATAKDRVAAAAAFEEAAMAEAVEDLVDDDTLEVLRASADELARSTGMPSPGSLSALVEPSRVASWGSLRVGTATVLVIVAAAAWFFLGAGFGLVIVTLELGAVGLVTRRNRPAS